MGPHKKTKERPEVNRDRTRPQSEKEVEGLVLNKGQYVLIDNVLYHMHIAMDGMMSSPAENREVLI